MSLTEKQTYYEYGLSGWEPKIQPSLDPFINEELERMGGKDVHGDPIYVIRWLGVTLVRTDHNADPQVIGDPRMVRPLYGRLEPRILAGRSKKPKWLCYHGEEDGKRVIKRVKRADEVPANISVTWWEYEYFDFGVCRWAVCRKLDLEQLVLAGIYKPNDEIPPEGEYYILKVLQQGGYYMEPTVAWLEAVKSTKWEAENADLEKLAFEDMEARAKARKEQEQKEEAAEDAEASAVVDEILRDEDAQRVYSTPTALRRAPNAVNHHLHVSPDGSITSEAARLTFPSLIRK